VTVEGPALRPKLIGHRGAPALAAANTLASFDAALAAGCEGIELDVLTARGDGRGPLYVAHDRRELRGRPPLALELALDHLAEARFGGVELEIDLKLPGYAERVGQELRHRGLCSRSLVCSTSLAELELAGRTVPELRLGWTVPRLPIDYRDNRLSNLGAIAAGRRLLPARAARVLAAGRAHALLAHWQLVTPALLAAVHGAGGQLYAWTLREAEPIRRLWIWGADGLIVDDPALYHAAFGSVARLAPGRPEQLPRPGGAVRVGWSSRWRRRPGR